MMMTCDLQFVFKDAPSFPKDCLNSIKRTSFVQEDSGNLRLSKKLQCAIGIKGETKGVCYPRTPRQAAAKGHVLARGEGHMARRDSARPRAARS